MLTDFGTMTEGSLSNEAKALFLFRGLPSGTLVQIWTDSVLLRTRGKGGSWLVKAKIAKAASLSWQRGIGLFSGPMHNVAAVGGCQGLEQQSCKITDIP